MKFRTFLLAALFSFTFITAGNLSPANLPGQNIVSTIKHSDKLLYETTYQRVKIDGVWWIWVYQDGVKVQEYIDPDQS